MALSFNGSSDYVTAGNAGTPSSITVAAWVNMNVLPTGGNDSMVICKPYVAGSFGSPFIQYALDVVDTGGGISHARMLVNTTGAFAAQGVTNIGTATWIHIGGTFDSSTGSALVYYNGAVDGTVGAGTNSLDNTNVTNLVFGVQSDTSTGAFLNGTIAEIGIWSTSLTAAEMVSLAKGYSPALVRPQNLTGYWPLLRANVAVKGAIPVPTGTTVVPHPRIIMPRTTKARKLAAAAAPPATTLFAQACL